MKVFKRLNISGTLLNKEQLSEYMEKLAASQDIKVCSDKNTYPIPSLLENYKFILKTYKLLNEHIKLGVKIHSAGEWILDNFYIIEENVKVIKKELNLKKYKKLIGTNGFARVYVLASEIVAYTDCKINRENIYLCLDAYQRNKVLSNEELNMLETFLKIAVINYIADLCIKIYFSQIEKIKVESIIERIIENKSIKERKFLYKSLKNAYISEAKFAFIEYMSYRLKKYGKFTIEYQKILEKEVQKAGLSVAEVIQKEHSYIANLKILMGNCIKSLKEVSRIDFVELLGKMNGIEEILNKDPINVYKFMDEASKSLYRIAVQDIAKKYRISEIYVAEKVVEFAEQEKEERKRHVGYFLVDKGSFHLKEKLSNRKVEKYLVSFKSKLYIGTFVALTLYLNFLISVRYSNSFVVLYILLLVPISEIVLRLINYIMGKCKEPKILPKMDFEKGIPDSAITAVVIPTVLKNKEKVKEMMRKLEVYYLANMYDNLYFVLLGDCSEEELLNAKNDKSIIETGIQEVERLNEKYSKNMNFDRFHFIYRKRSWNDSEGKFIGWERKRGLLFSFNEFIKLKKEKDFSVNTMKKQIENLPNFKYVITLDSDTNLVLDSATKLIGAMAHVLNKPKVINKKVVEGYGIMQPRIGLDLKVMAKSEFVELYAMQGGIDLYTNAISDIYQDYFEEGIFTGKGIYDVEVYNEILNGEIPENTVLSHDLLEGNYLRCGLLTDVMLLDGYPYKYISYIDRNHRWVRGDIQILKWLKAKNLNRISKFKIFDNLRRSLVKPAILLNLLLALFMKNDISIVLIIVSTLGLLITNILDVINFIIFKESVIKGAIYSHKKFSKDKNVISLNLCKSLLEFLFLPYEAYKNLDAIIRSVYRIKRKQKLLEWTTSEDNELKTKNTLCGIYKKMGINVIFSLIFIVFGNNLLKILGFLWLVSPIVAKCISEEKNEKFSISKNDREKLLDIGRRTWSFFEDHITEENNYLICDNYQNDRKEKFVKRTSSTNIGLEYISILSAFDLGYIDFEKAIFYLIKLTNTVKFLAKWNGHLYNWYRIDNLEPLKPRYISTVDSGNFVGYLYIVKTFLEKNLEKENTNALYSDICYLIDETDFSHLYSKENKLLSIGFNLEENSLTDSYYDFLASEARQASLIAIAKKNVPVRHWNALNRTITIFQGYKGLVSWTGTAFEYLMPNLNLESYKGSLLDESSKFAILSQKEYCNSLYVPWGISESAFNIKDLNNNYQYKAFGIPWLGLKRGLENDLVISPYSTFLALNENEEEVMDNIKALERSGAYGKYGFYEAIDYTLSRLKNKEKSAVVKTYMAHHQGLILNSINNYLNDFILKKRFNENVEIEAVNTLLEERMPMQMIITKEKKEKPEKQKNKQEFGYVEENLDKGKETFYHLIANKEYMIVLDNKGYGYSKYKDYVINKYRKNWEFPQGINFYVKNLKSKKIRKIGEDFKVIYAQDKMVFSKRDGKLKYTFTVTIDPNKAIEIRSLEIENLGSSEEIIEVVCDFIPILSTFNEEVAHSAFNSMFIKYEKENDAIVLKRVSRDLKNSIYLATILYTENGKIVDKGFEIDAEKYYGRERFSVPKMLEENINFSNSLNYAVNKVVAQKQTLKIGSKEKVKVNLTIAVSEEKEEAISLLKDIDVSNILEISKAKVEEEMKYLQISKEKILDFQNLLSVMLNESIIKNLFIGINKKYEINDLWKFGISGDIDILTVKIRSVADIEYLEEILEAYLYFRLKKFWVELIIINEENNVYKRYLKEEIDGLISNKQVDYLKNIKTGIFVLNSNEIEREDLELIYLKSKIILDVTNGGINNFIKNLKKNNHKIKKVINFEEEENNYKVSDNLRFFNGVGGFTDDFREYKFYPKNGMFSVWSNVISNKIFGAVVTENMLDVVWHKNSRLNRITSWNNDSVKNIPSQIIYFRDLDNNKIWSLNNNILKNNSFDEITYGFGFAKYKKIFNKIEHETIIFVPNEENRIITNIKLKNLSNEKRNLKTVIYFKIVLGEDELRSKGNIYVEKLNNYILMKNVLGNGEISYITSNFDINKFTKSKKIFFGNGDINCPDSLFNYELDNKSGIGDSVGIELELILEPNEEKECNIIIGQENEVENIFKLDIENVSLKLEDVKKKWNNLNNTLSIITPDEEVNALLSGWLVYQTLSCRLWGRSAFYQSGGAIGFRDQLQDCLGIKYIDINLLKEQILKCAACQFEEGDVLHWWHDEIKRGSRTHFSDDLLWLPYGVLEYLEFTGDYDFLDEKLGYITGEKLADNESEKYEQYHRSELEESLYCHCIRAVKKSLKFGDNGFPKIGSGDWNDGFSNVGVKGSGESVWLGFFIYDILNRFIKICEIRKDINNYNNFVEIKENLKKNLNNNGWDGRWFKRAITDNKEELGSLMSEECKIDSISQSWSVISDAADNDKKFISMQEAENYLVDRENKIIKLFTPAFEKSKVNPGYIKAYPAGIRENGGQYTHAAVWFIIALAKLGFNEKAIEFIKMISPLNHTSTIEALKKYRLEPFAIPADIYDVEGGKGTGGWSWYTGSSSWFYKALVEYIVGFKIENNHLVFNPCISKAWKNVEIHYKYKTSMYNIKINNLGRDVEKVIVNGKIIEDKKVKLLDDGKIYNIEVILS